MTQNSSKPQKRPTRPDTASGTSLTLGATTPPNSEFPLEAFYTKEVMDHFLNPRHVGILQTYNAKGEVGNIVCGDIMRIYLLVEPDNHGQLAIANISFETYGCGAAIATSSITTEMAFGRTLTEALQIEKDDVIKQLVKLPAQKIHCSILAVDALREAIYQYLQQNKLEVPAKLQQQHDIIDQTRQRLKKQYESWLK